MAAFSRAGRLGAHRSRLIAWLGERSSAESGSRRDIDAERREPSEKARKLEPDALDIKMSGS
jgi:hypothetical protein